VERAQIYQNLKHLKVGQQTMYDTFKRYLETRSVHLKPRVSSPMSKRSPNLVKAASKKVERNPRCKVTKMATDLTMSKSTMGKLIKEDLKMKCYHLQCCLSLSEVMKLKRVDKAKVHSEKAEI